ncbi:MAG: hypothetical protein LUB61_07315 [Eggerthellaceae bacterium]|nr:hypothetical protein [Eggerthellaceae bacterium]
MDFQRGRLLDDLKENLQKLRIVYGLSGFGKRTLVAQYCKREFDFKHVLWLDASWPSIRDRILDETLADQILIIDPELRLVVFGDAPSADNKFIQKFLNQIRALLDTGVEVVMISGPYGLRRYSHLEEIFMIGPKDLLLDSDEIMELYGSCCIAGDDPMERICCLHFGRRSTAALLSSLKDEPVDPMMHLLMLAMLLLGHGRFLDLIQLVPGLCPDKDLQGIWEAYRIFEVDFKKREFRAIDVSVQMLSHVFSHKSKWICSLFTKIPRELFFETLADILYRRGETVRALGILYAFTSQLLQIEWLEDKSWEMLEEFHLDPLCRLLKGQLNAKKKLNAPFLGACAWSLYFMGQTELACTCAIKACNVRESDTREHIMSDILLRRCMRNSSLREDTELLMLDPSMEAAQAQALKVLAMVAANIGTRDEIAYRVWSSIVSKIDPADAGEELEPVMKVLCLSACWFMKDFGGDAAKKKMYFSAMKFAAARLEMMCAKNKPLDIFSWSAGCLLLNGSEDAMSENNSLISERTAAYILKRSAVFSEEKRRYLNGCGRRNSAAAEPESPGVCEAVINPSREIPRLRIEVFSGGNLYLDDALLETDFFKCKKAKTLLEILALNRNSAISRRRLTELLWPQSTPERAVKNFYPVMNSIEGALSVNGSCPYVHFGTYDCILDKSHVECDIDEFEELCKKLTSDANSATDWINIFGDIAGKYYIHDCDFGNPYIDSVIRRCNEKLVDALVRASSKMRKEGELMGSIWFASEALMRDPLREDACALKMLAQKECGQVCAAINTYNECRRSLKQTSGISPSLKLVNLYNKLLDDT